jgi:hypothetical protein
MNKWVGLSNVPGLSIWLDGADPLGTGVPPAIGAVVPTWVDKSGLGRNATATGSPTWSNGVVFNASPYYTIPYPGTHSTETGFVVVSFSNFSEATLIGGDTLNSRLLYQLNSTLLLSEVNVADIVTTTTSYSSNTTVLLGYTLSSSTSTTATLYTNGTSNATGTYATPIPAENFIHIGASAFSGYFATKTLNGTVREVLIYSNVLTTTQRQLIEGYLATKWSMQASLPADHPYLSTPVTGYNPRNQYSTPSNVGYLAVPQDAVSMNPATSVLSYDGTSWSVE